MSDRSRVAALFMVYLLAISFGWAGVGQARADEIDDLRAEVKKLKAVEVSLRAELDKLKQDNDKKKREDELKEAKDVVVDFLTAIQKKQFANATSLMAPDYKRDLAPVKDIIDDKDLSYKKIDLDKFLESFGSKLSSYSVTNYLDAGKFDSGMAEVVFNWDKTAI